MLTGKCSDRLRHGLRQKTAYNSAVGIVTEVLHRNEK